MLALRVEDQKAFTSALFLGERFDSFLVREAAFVTFNRFEIDGHVRSGYYSEDERLENGMEEYSAWKQLRPFCYSLIRGKRLPETFRIVFLLPKAAKERFVLAHAPSLAPDTVGGLYLNVQYEKQELTCITGTSMTVFTTDRSLEHEWDEAVRGFLRKNGIAVRE